VAPAGSDTFPQAFGKFELLERMAQGGMAEVLLAVEDSPLTGRRFVSIKRIRAEHRDDPDFVDFFLTEARVSLKFAHPNLPQMFELGCIDGQHYLAMEYIHGYTLLGLLHHTMRGGRLLSLNVPLSVGIGVAAALEHAHGLRDVDGEPLAVVHRDVTPQNVMISSAGAVKLIDFGIVRSTLQTHRTRKGIIKGKFAYMAPEQLDGSESLDHRADLFALGVVIHETICARPLFRGRHELDTLDRIRSAPIPDPAEYRSDVPPELAAVVLKALARDPDQRFQSASDMLSALEYVTERCGLATSIIRLRDEAAALCGATPAPEIDGASAPRRAGSGLGQDPQLLYFLRRAGARLPEDSDAAADGHGEPL
jgi:eukaryotic-like serine/threonine-protein kinase